MKTNTPDTPPAAAQNTRPDLPLPGPLAQQRERAVPAMEMQLRTAGEKIAQLEWTLYRTTHSPAYRLGRLLLAPAERALRLARRLRGKIVRQVVFRRTLRQVTPGAYSKKIDLGEQPDLNFGRHRSGLKYGLNWLAPLHKPGGVRLDAFIERTFGWASGTVEPHTTPWIGFIHIPPHPPDWFLPEQTNQAIFNTRAWQESAPFCQGLFAFSQYHRAYLQTIQPLPVDAILLPTATPRLQWSIMRFERNRAKKIIQIGWWLRMLHAIFMLPKTAYQKMLLDAGHPSVPFLMQQEKERLVSQGQFHDMRHDDVTRLHYMSAGAYDRLLSENIVFLYLYDASANNSVIECMVRRTPLLVNPLPAVVEYLGPDYPFYYQSFAEAAAKASDHDLVCQTHLYLQRHAVTAKLTGQHFLDSIAASPLYRGLEP